jgi:hypothetical protein
MNVTKMATRVFHPSWFATGLAIGLGIQFLAWLTGFGLFGGLSAYVAMGVLVGWASSGDTVIEPGVAAFVIATLGFVLDHFLLSVLGVGLIMAGAYGFVGLLLGMAGGWAGEQLQELTR